MSSFQPQYEDGGDRAMMTIMTMMTMVTVIIGSEYPPVCKPPMLCRAQLRSQPEHPSKIHGGDDYSGNDKPVVSESGWTVSIGHPVKHNHGDVSDDECIGIGKVDKFQIFLSNPLWQRCHIFSGQHYSICSGYFANIAIF